MTLNMPVIVKYFINYYLCSYKYKQSKIFQWFVNVIISQTYATIDAGYRTHRRSDGKVAKLQELNYHAFNSDSQQFQFRDFTIGTTDTYVNFIQTVICKYMNFNQLQNYHLLFKKANLYAFVKWYYNWYLEHVVLKDDYNIDDNVL